MLRVLSRRAALASIPLFGLLGSAGAQTPKAPLSWQSCLAIARESVPDYQAAVRTVKADEASYKGSYDGLLPQINLSNSYTNANVETAFGTSGSTYWEASASANWQLLNASSLASVKAAAATLTQGQANLIVVSANLRQSLALAFAQLLYAQRNVEVTKAIYDIRDKDAQMLRLRYDAGNESKGDMMRADAQVLGVKLSLEQAYRDLRTAQMLLDREMGMDDFAVISATGSLQPPPAPPRPEDFHPLAEHRPEVLVQIANLAAADAGVRVAQSPLYPALSLNYSRTGIQPHEFPTPLANNSFTAMLSYPLFGSGPLSAYYNIQSAHFSREQVEQTLHAVRLQAISDLQSDWDSLVSQQDQATAAFALLAADRQRNAEADVEYESGILTYNNWDIIVTSRISDESNAITQELQAAQALATWERVLGKGLQEP